MKEEKEKAEKEQKREKHNVAQCRLYDIQVWHKAIACPAEKFSAPEQPIINA